MFIRLRTQKINSSYTDLDLELLMTDTEIKTWSK